MMSLENGKIPAHRIVVNRPLHLSREYTVFGPNAYTEGL